jgi:hypothetical protein
VQMCKCVNVYMCICVNVRMCASMCVGAHKRCKRVLPPVRVRRAGAASTARRVARGGRAGSRTGPGGGTYMCSL